MRTVADQDDHPTKEHFDTTIDNLREHTAAAVSAAEPGSTGRCSSRRWRSSEALLAILRLIG